MTPLSVWPAVTRGPSAHRRDPWASPRNSTDPRVKPGDDDREVIALDPTMRRLLHNNGEFSGAVSMHRDERLDDDRRKQRDHPGQPDVGHHAIGLGLDVRWRQPIVEYAVGDEGERDDVGADHPFPVRRDLAPADRIERHHRATRPSDRESADADAPGPAIR